MTSSPRLWRRGFTSLVNFIRDPSDLGNSFDAFLLLAGPHVQREFQRFAQHPMGRRLLARRPRPNLNELLSDREALESMPPGSFGQAYLDYLDDRDMGSATYFLQAARLQEKAATLGWSPDQLWFIERLANSHDLFHVLTGYGRDIAGEVGVISYTAGHFPILPLKLLLGYFMTLKPSQPRDWTQFVLRSYHHGTEATRLTCLDYEGLLPQPLDTVRKVCGIRPMEHVHPEGMPARGALLRAFENKIQLA